EPTTRTRKPPAPAVGSCYRLSYEQAVAPTARAPSTPCREAHTAVTFHVGRLERVVDGRLLAVDARRLQEQVSTTCPRLLPAHVGGTEEQRRLSMLRSVWFTPTLRQADAGADWFRCDAVALARSSRLLELAGSLSDVLDTAAGRNRFGMCGTAEPGTPGFERVACALPHSWRALRTVGLPGPDYPGEGAVQRAGEEPCSAAARAAAPDPLDFQWGYEFPTPDLWQAGQTYGICWAPV
ncbi:MAG: septum formation family protein, partial [Nocardioides sp.]